MKNKQQDYSQLIFDYYISKKKLNLDINVSLEPDVKQNLHTKLKKCSKQFALSSG